MSLSHAEEHAPVATNNTNINTNKRPLEEGEGGQTTATEEAKGRRLVRSTRVSTKKPRLENVQQDACPWMHPRSLLADFEHSCEDSEQQCLHWCPVNNLAWHAANVLHELTDYQLDTMASFFPLEELQIIASQLTNAAETRASRTKRSDVACCQRGQKGPNGQELSMD